MFETMNQHQTDALYAGAATTAVGIGASMVLFRGNTYMYANVAAGVVTATAVYLLKSNAKIT